MAPFGKIYSFEGNPRATRVLALAEQNGLEIEIPQFISKVTNTSPEFRSKFPFGKVPAFEGADGFCLTEGIAIASYVAKSGPKAGQLLGTDDKTQALILQWVSFSETELLVPAMTVVAMAIMKAYERDEKRFNLNITAFERAVKYLQTTLQGGKKYLVGNEYTLADYLVTSSFYWGFKHLIGTELRKEIPDVVAYVQAFADIPEHKKHLGELEFGETQIKLE